MRHYLLALALLFPTTAFAGPYSKRVESVVSEGVARHALWGIYAVDIANGNVLADVNGTKTFIPASNRKLVSTAMATNWLKPDQKFATTAHGNLPNSGGVVEGDLYVKAVGDPSWTPELLNGASGIVKLREMARQIKSAGVTRIDGNLVIDTTRFLDAEPTPPAWSWEELATSYGSRPSVLAMNQNLIGVSLVPSGTGQPVDVRFPIGVDAFNVVNNSNTLQSGSAPTLVLQRELNGGAIILEGGLPAGSNAVARSVPAGKPVEIVAQVFRNALEREGIEVRGDIRTARMPAGLAELARVEGASVADMVLLANRDSNNFVSESLYLLVSAEVSGRGSYTSAQQIEQGFWRRLNVDGNEVVSSDGSGLSRKNHISPRALVELLRSKNNDEVFKNSLPVSGRSGTLRYRLSQNGMAGRVQAKTGTLDGVSALSGYIRTNSGKTVAFSIMANNAAASNATLRNRIDRVVEELAGY